ncbi:GFA family protein [Bosea sp. Root483D1]|uniref:GFA family protein n=1 Tax=Bosea sp. Root483D1 TaxID=1736544 RepID=UPI000AC43B6E|nr:GFA family protein [Bosea sp. Root483D1]
MPPTTTMVTEPTARQRTACCGCRRLRLTVSGEPCRVYLCACSECRRATGSAFAYRAIFAESAIVAIEGEASVWRRGSDAGRWIEQVFCPGCGGLVFMRAEAMPGAISVSAGSFTDPGFPAPAAIHNRSHQPDWYRLADTVSAG